MSTSDRQSDQSPPHAAAGGRSWVKDIWQLHIPLLLALALCTTATVIEIRRADQVVWRAWIYLFEWPMIGAFCIWMWWRLWREGSVKKARTSLTDRWRAKVARIEAEYDASHPDPVPAAGDPAELKTSTAADEGLQQWQAYVNELRRTDPPGNVH